MAKVDELEVLIKANTAELKAGLKSVEGQLSSFGKNASAMGGKLSAGAVALGGVIANVVSKVIDYVMQEMDEAVKRLDTLNNFPKVMSNLGIEAGVSTQAINKLSEDLKGLPTSLSDAVSAVQRLTAVNNNLEYSTDAFLALNNAIIAGGGSMQAQQSALEQLNQAYAKGKPEMNDWKILMQAMPAQLKQIGIAMGYASSNELYQALQSGQATMTDFMNTIMRLNKEGVAGFASFSDQARSATGGVATAMTNLKISIQRGIADIMNIIGQTNISGFINGIANAIGTVANYVAAFVRILKEAFAWVRALFGGGSGSTAEAVKSTSSGLAGVASSAGGVSDNLDKATGSAKKLKKQLASFDEMNVLQEQTSGGGGGSGSSGGGGGINVGDYSWDTSSFETSGDKIGKIVDNLKKKFNELFGDLDFSKIGVATIGLWRGIQKAIDGARKIGEQFIEKFIVPLTKHAVENTIPELMDSIAYVLNRTDFDKIAKASGNFFSGLADVGKILLDIISGIASRLAPIITWVNNFVVPPALNILGGILKIIANIIGGIWDALTAIWDEVIMPTLSSIGKFFEPVLDMLNQGWDAVNNNAEVWETLRTVVKEFTKVLLNLVIGPLLKAIEGFGQLTNAMIELMKATNPTLKAYYEAREQEEKLQEKNEKLEKSVDELRVATVDYNNAIKEKNKLQNQATSIIEKLADSEKNLTEKEQALRIAETESGTQVRLNADNMDKLISKMSLATTHEEQLKVVADKYNLSMDTQREDVEKLWRATVDYSDAINKHDDVLQEQIELNENLKRVETESIEKKKEMKNKVDELRKTYEETGKDTEWLRNKIKELSNEGTEDSKIMANELRKELRNSSKFFQEAFDNIYSKSSSTKSSIVGTWKGVKDTFKQLGIDAGKGFGSNMDSYMQTYAKTAAQNVVNRIKEKLKIHSPSKVFAEIGGYVSEGFAEGIMDKSNTVMSAFEEISQFTIPELGLNSDMNIGMSEDLEDLSQQPIQLLLQIDGESIPVSASRITNALNDQTFLNNQNLLTI